MRLIEIVEKLVGPTAPVGESNEDARRYENLLELIGLTNDLIVMIDNVADSKGRPEHSIRKAGLLADQFMQEIRNF